MPHGNTSRPVTIHNDSTMNENGNHPRRNASSERPNETTGDHPPSLEEIEYGIHSFYSIVRPVFVTMLFSALAVIYISTEQSRREGEEALASSYTVLRGSEDDSTAQKLGQSLVNGLLIVSAICFITFMIVLLYKYRCMKILLGYMIVAMVSLMGFVSADMFFIAIERYNLRIDKVSFAITIYNFAAVGAVAVFAGQHGIPTVVTQGYLIAISIMVAWQLSHFDAWTAWALLVLLALYDLFAVLTPCGPLKALVNLMQREDAPQLPGLLFEARVESNGDNNPSSNNNNSSSNGRGMPSESRRTTRSVTNAAVGSASQTGPEMTPTNQGRTSRVVSSQAKTDEKRNHTPTSETLLCADDQCVYEERDSNDTQSQRKPPMNRVDDENLSTDSETCRGLIPLGMALFFRFPYVLPDGVSDVLRQNWTNEELQTEVEVEFLRGIRIVRHRRQRPNEEIRYKRTGPKADDNAILFVNANGFVMTDLRDNVTGWIPLAIAKHFKLPFAADPQPSWIRRNYDGDQDGGNIEEYSVDSLRRDVEVVFPRNGLRIIRYEVPRENDEPRYALMNPDNSIRKVLFVNRSGSVFEDLQASNGSTSARKVDRSTIRLGLGDFIFYSILVSKAALYSFATFASCTVSILIGLAMTLAILAVRQKALPALPISIFLGVLSFLVTRYSIEPWIHDLLLLHQSYV